MKALTVELNRLIRNERINRKHAESFKTGRSGKRFDWLTVNMLVSAMAAYGHKSVCHIVKAAEDELDYRDLMRSLPTK